MRLFFIVLVFQGFILSAQTAQEILEKAIDYHDPDRQWKSLEATFSFKENRPDGADRRTILKLKNAENWHSLNRNDEEIYEIDGRGNVNFLMEKGDGDRARMLRSYYVYLWGLPMKLFDKGTPVDSKTTNRTIKGLDCYGVVVPYNKETYTFYFSKENYRMVAYQFFKNDDSGKGEMIHLKDEIKFKKMRIPKERSWYELPNDKYLGSDILETVE